MTNRRAFERFAPDMVFWIRPSGGNEEDYQPFDVKDISGGGIACKVDRVYKTGDHVELSFELPQHTDLIDAIGEVRHVCELEENIYEIGVQFKEVKGLTAYLLIDYLEELFK